MSNKIMVVNAGSSSLKFKLYEMPEEKVLTQGIFERIGLEEGIFQIEVAGENKKEYLQLSNHAVCVTHLVKVLVEEGIVSDLNEITGVGHRVVQGGKYFSDAALLDEKSENLIEMMNSLAPLHNPAHLIGIRAFKEVLPNVNMTATFDTAYHQSMEMEDYLFPIPYEYYEDYDIRRYGAHGTSHHYLALEAKNHELKDSKSQRVITCHIGSGASITASRDAKCVATSMGLTPLGGIMMGTRCGDIDPSVYKFIAEYTNQSIDEVYDTLYKKSGLIGVSGVSSDTRDIEAAIKNGDKRALAAAKLFARRIADYIGQYYIRLGGADLIVFSAGIGENSPYFRKLVVDNIASALNLRLDEQANKSSNRERGIISTPDSKVKVAIIPTDEEIMIARDCIRILNLN